jgi:serine/threonine protein kinase
MQGLEHIHHKNYVHLDLKPSNIFITERGTLKIGDYGVMRTAEEIKNKMLNSDPSVSYNDIEEFKHMIEGDSRYLAPEFQQSPNALNSSGTHIRTTRSRARTSMIGPWSDIWALGLIVLELALDIIVPAGGSEQWSTLRAGIFPDTLEQSSISPSLRELVKWMMMPNPNDRPTASQLLQHYRSRLNDDSIAVDFDSFVKRDSRATLTNSVGLRDSMEIEAWNSQISTHYQASFDRKAVKPKREVSLAASGAFMSDESSSEESELSAVTPVNPAPLLLNPAMPIMPRKLSFADMDDD